MQMNRNIIAKCLVFCAAGFLPVAASADIPHFGDMLWHLQSQLSSVSHLIVAVSYLAGITLVLRGLFKLKLYGDMRVMMSNNANIGEPLTLFSIGAILIFLPNLLDVSMQTMWGVDYNTVMSYDVDTSGHWGDVMQPIASLIQVIGFIAFLRGWFFLSKITAQGYQQGVVGKGFMHILGGILAINIVGTIDMLKATFFG